jgi:hypothetical protein
MQVYGQPMVAVRKKQKSETQNGVAAAHSAGRLLGLGGQVHDLKKDVTVWYMEDRHLEESPLRVGTL